MPHLRLELAIDHEADAKQRFADWLTDLYSDVMDTGTDHVAVTVDEHDPGVLSLGRVDDPRAGIALLDADIRAGRSLDQRREFATRVMDEVGERWDVPTENMYVVYTEHPGEDFLLREGPLESWASGETDPGRES